MTRRAALRKLGFGAGMAAFSLLGVDDLARIAGKRMERVAGDNKVAEQVAKEFQQAGVAFADLTSGSGSGCFGRPCGISAIATECQHCANQGLLDFCYCEFHYGQYAAAPYSPNPTMHHICTNQATYNQTQCDCCWCPAGGAVSATITCPPVGNQQPPQGCNC